MGTVCKRLRFGDIWIVQDPIGRKGVILVAWSDKVKVTVVRQTDFCMELKVMIENEKGNFWATFVYASTDINERKEQWNELIERRKMWGKKWIIGGISMI